MRVNKNICCLFQFSLILHSERQRKESRIVEEERDENGDDDHDHKGQRDKSFTSNKRSREKRRKQTVRSVQTNGFVGKS